MREQDIIKQLKRLESIVPGNEWKSRNKEILMAQISGAASGRKVSGFKVAFNLLPYQLRRFTAQPVTVVFLILLIVFGSGIAGIMASSNAVPGDSLYIAKRLSEQTQFALTFGETAKTKLTLEFAENRAKELAQVLSQEPDQKNKQETVDKLTQNFNNEIDSAKSRITKIVKTETPAPAAETLAGDKADNEEATTTPPAEDSRVFSADLGREEKGIEVSGGGNTSPEPATETPETIATDTSEQVTGDSDNASATGSDAVVSEQAESTSGDPQKILEEAKELFTKQDIDGTLSKLEQVNDLIDNGGQAAGQDSGEVKGAEDSATSSVDQQADDNGEVMGAEEAATTSELVN